MRLLRLWHAIVGHDWNILLVDQMRAVALVHLCTWAGCLAECRCGVQVDDLSPEAREHFITKGRLLIAADGTLEVRRD